LGVSPAKDEKPEDAEQRLLRLRRYILGLALVALTQRDGQQFNLREGCLLRVRESSVWKAVPFEGEETGISVDADVALTFAQAASKNFRVQTFERAFVFDKEKANKWLALKKDDRDKLRRKGSVVTQALK
jgi:hypothetical protein